MPSYLWVILHPSWPHKTGLRKRCVVEAPRGGGNGGCVGSLWARKGHPDVWNRASSGVSSMCGCEKMHSA